MSETRPITAKQLAKKLDKFEKTKVKISVPGFEYAYVTGVREQDGEIIVMTFPLNKKSNE